MAQLTDENLDYAIELLIKSKPRIVMDFKVPHTLHDRKWRVPGVCDRLAKHGIVLLKIDSKFLHAFCAYIPISDEEYEMTVSYRNFMDRLHETVNASIELDEVFRPALPKNYEFSKEGSTHFYSFNVSGIDISVEFDEEPSGYEMSFTSMDGKLRNSERRVFRDVNTVELFQYIIGIAVKFVETTGVHDLTIKPPSHEASRLTVYSKIMNRPEVEQYLRKSGLLSRFTPAGIVIEKR